MRHYLRAGLVMSALFAGALATMPQSAPDQPPSQQQTPPPQTQPAPESNGENASPSSPAGQEKSPPAANENPQGQQGSAEQEQAPAQSQTSKPDKSQAAPDPNIPVLKHRPARKPAHKKPTSSQSGKVVVKNGGAREGKPELAPGSSGEQAQHNLANTTQLLATTDANLKSVAGRALSPAQQSMMEQIRTYVAQSKAANNAGDLDRAHTLAYKAHLLSDELAKK